MEIVAGVVALWIGLAMLALAWRALAPRPPSADPVPPPPPAPAPVPPPPPPATAAEPRPPPVASGAPLPAALGVDEARELLERSGAYPYATRSDSVFDLLQGSPAFGHVIEPFAAFGNGDYVVAWQIPGRPGPPVMALVDEHGDHRVIAPSPLVFLQYLGARWSPAWHVATDLEAEEAAALDALRAQVGPPPFPPDSEAHRDALGPLPDLSDAVLTYDTAASVARRGEDPPWWAQGALAPAWLTAESGDLPGALRQARAVVDGRPTTAGERQGLADWCDAVGAHELAASLRAIDPTPAGATHAPHPRPADHAERLDALRASVVVADDEARGPLEAELGLRLCLDERWREALEHLTHAALHLSSRHPHVDLVIEIAEAIDADGSLGEQHLERVRAALP